MIRGPELKQLLDRKPTGSVLRGWLRQYRLARVAVRRSGAEWSFAAFLAGLK